MPPAQSRSVRIDTNKPGMWHLQDGREICPLFSSEYEEVSLQRLKPCTNLAIGLDSTEVLIVSGEIVLEDQGYVRGSWLRFSVNDSAHAIAGENGATVYLKTGHLRDHVVKSIQSMAVVDSGCKK